MQADRRQVYPPGTGWGARMLIFWLCNRAGNIACCGAWETPLCLSLWTIVVGSKMGWGVQKTVAGRGSLLLQLLRCFSSELSYCAFLTCMDYSAPEYFFPHLTGGCCWWWLDAFEVTGLLIQLTCVLCACCKYTHTIQMHTHGVSWRIYSSGWGRVRQNLCLWNVCNTVIGMIPILLIICVSQMIFLFIDRHERL